jgi:hypothetical protein
VGQLLRATQIAQGGYSAERRRAPAAVADGLRRETGGYDARDAGVDGRRSAAREHEHHATVERQWTGSTARAIPACAIEVPAG